MFNSSLLFLYFFLMLFEETVSKIPYAEKEGNDEKISR